jgi:hypothetical protein
MSSEWGLQHSFFADVEKENGIPVLLTRWGFKKIRFNGRIYLTPMTNEEHDAFKKDRNSLFIEDIPSDVNTSGYCVGVGYTSCSPVQGCHRCVVIQHQFGYTCDCSG